MAPKSKLEKTREANTIARLELNTKIAKHRTAVLNEYDAVRANKERRQPVVERKKEGEIYKPRKRLLGANLGRDLERNYPPAKSILHQMKANVVGPLGKIQVNTKNGAEATEWFNSDWAKDCDYRDPGIHYSMQLQNVVTSVVREGDLLAVVDDNLIDDTGKLVHWESDQIAKLDDKVFDKLPNKADDWKQDNGIIRGKMGRVLSYVATGEHGLTILNEDQATVYPVEVARLVKNPWRLNQGRGVPSLITSATSFQDLYEILSKELQSAKVNASLAGYVKRPDAVGDWSAPGTKPEFLPENSGKGETQTDEEGANDSDNTARNYENFEALTGGFMDYINPKDEIKLHDIRRPNVHLADFIEAVLGSAGSSMGFARAYSLLRADRSYTSFRGDMILTWVSIIMLQKWLERMYADWTAIKVLTWAQRKKKIKTLEDGWKRKISWTWPVMPHVDELKERMATKQGLKNGEISWADLLGPEWKKKFEILKEGADLARQFNLPLSFFETSSGNSAEEILAADNNGDTDKDDD